MDICLITLGMFDYYMFDYILTLFSIFTPILWINVWHYHMFDYILTLAISWYYSQYSHPYCGIFLNLEYSDNILTLFSPILWSGPTPTPGPLSLSSIFWTHSATWLVFVAKLKLPNIKPIWPKYLAQSRNVVLALAAPRINVACCPDTKCCPWQNSQN